MLKYAKNLLEKSIQESETPRFSNDALPSRFEPPTQQETSTIDTPEMIIGENVTVSGTLAFSSCVRVDGLFEGTIESQGVLIVGPKGVVKADLDLKEAYIAGKVEGNISVKERLILRGRAEIRGNITAPKLSIDEGVSIIGQVYVTGPSTTSDEI
jgi:cytoskeletal protein CcmA (bactofilin family)